MKTLPYPPAEPLHVLPPWLVWALLWIAAAVVLGLLGWWWLRRLGWNRNADAGTAPPVSGRALRGATFSSVVDTIQESHLRREDYRGGAHALSGAVKTRIEKLAGIEAEEMTVGEIQEMISDRGLGALLHRLLRSQFGKEPPGKRDFVDLCTTAKNVLGRRRRLKIRT